MNHSVLATGSGSVASRGWVWASLFPYTGTQAQHSQAWRGFVLTAEADGSGAPDIELKSEMLPPGWKEGVNLASTRTDSKGRYVLRLPAPVEGVLISVDQPIRAPDGTFRQVRPVGRSGKGSIFRFDRLTEDVKDADWAVGSEE